MARTQPGCYGQPELNNPHIHNQGLPILFFNCLFKSCEEPTNVYLLKMGRKGQNSQVDTDLCSNLVEAQRIVLFA